MQDPNEDTEWNDILRKKGILPPKEAEVTEDDLAAMVDEAAANVIRSADGKPLEDMTLDELDEIEDEEEERILLEMRQKRLAEMKAQAARSKFGEIINITAAEYTKEINQAGPGVWVVVFLYKNEVLVCRRLQQILKQLASKFPAVKFVQSISTSCIPNYPDRNLPTVFVYFEVRAMQQSSYPQRKGLSMITCSCLFPRP
eukprot:TRINITY_DN12036_c0_g1_i5.p2 TRINITY_DN12036_c0_g1~~TRINITY_DN12036_c0_g1_i5.p2  ORF type:complete len:200 (+),score=61.44 TRINITY_DN12036_c0_g1_i5:16-615(+)